MITMAQVTTPSNARNNNNDSAAANNNTKEKKKQDTLFGPNIGIVSGGPDWTERTSDGKLVDELTPEIVKGWIAKSKEVSRRSDDNCHSSSWVTIYITYVGKSLTVLLPHTSFSISIFTILEQSPASGHPSDDIYPIQRQITLRQPSKHSSTSNVPPSASPPSNPPNPTTPPTSTPNTTTASNSNTTATHPNVASTFTSSSHPPTTLLINHSRQWASRQRCVCSRS